MENMSSKVLEFSVQKRVRTLVFVNEAFALVLSTRYNFVAPS